MQLAKGEAERLNQPYIEPAHILLGLLEEGTGVAVGALHRLGVDLSALRVEVEKQAQAPHSHAALPAVPLARSVIEYAIEESRRSNHRYIGTEHLLLGLLRVPDKATSHALANMGLDAHDTYPRVLDLLGIRGTPATENATDDTSD